MYVDVKEENDFAYWVEFLVQMFDLLLARLEVVDAILNGWALDWPDLLF